MAKQPTYNDIVNERPADLMRHYKISEKQMGQVVNKHSNDIKSSVERRKFYESVYNGKR
jgi:Mor family transcriptional regulator